MPSIPYHWFQRHMFAKVRISYAARISGSHTWRTSVWLRDIWGVLIEAFCFASPTPLVRQDVSWLRWSLESLAAMSNENVTSGDQNLPEVKKNMWFERLENPRTLPPPKGTTNNTVLIKLGNNELLQLTQGFTSPIPWCFLETQQFQALCHLHSLPAESQVVFFRTKLGSWQVDIVTP